MLLTRSRKMFVELIKPGGPVAHRSARGRPGHALAENNATSGSKLCRRTPHWARTQS